jgi:alpha-ketoglutarate-dependent taurine dioxygenase
MVERLLLDSGAVLFRGFDVGTAEAFERTVVSFSRELVDYTYRSTPRTQERDRIYTSTEYPPDQEILLHNENSYATRWPLRLWFCCIEPAAAGGETPLADSRRVYRRIDPSIRDRFARLGVLYVRNYSEFVDLPWQEVFQTDDPQAVDRYCAEAGIEARWRNGDLQTRQLSQAIAKHPRTGESVWFNQAHLFHPSGLPPAVRSAFADLLSEDQLPRNVLYGDGTSFLDADLEHIRKVYASEASDVRWERGDVLLVDNMLLAHGRRSFTPPRKVLVAMTEPVDARHSSPSS